MRHTTLLIAILLVIILPIGSYWFIKNHNRSKLSWYQTSKPVTKDLTQFVTATGKLKPLEQITVGSLVAGRVVKYLADDNDFVKENQVLVIIDNGIGYNGVKQAQGVLDEAKAALKYNESFYKRQKALYEAGQLAKDTFESNTKDYETLKAKVIEAEAALAIQQETYNNLTIRSPTTGTVIARKVDLGQMITAQFEATVLYIIAKDLKEMEASIDIDEADIGLIKEGQEGLFTVDAFPQRTFNAKVNLINYDSKVVENVVTYAVKLNVANPELTLRPGMTTNINIKVAEVKKALSISNKALRVDRNTLKEIAKKERLAFEEIPQTVENKARETLWILDGTTLKETFVKFGVTDGRFTQVIDGIAPNTEVVTEALDPNRENPVKMMGGIRA